MRETARDSEPFQLGLGMQKKSLALSGKCACEQFASSVSTSTHTTVAAANGST